MFQKRTVPVVEQKTQRDELSPLPGLPSDFASVTRDGLRELIRNYKKRIRDEVSHKERPAAIRLLAGAVSAKQKDFGITPKKKRKKRGPSRLAQQKMDVEESKRSELCLPPPLEPGPPVDDLVLAMSGLSIFTRTPPVNVQRPVARKSGEVRLHLPAIKG